MILTDISNTIKKLWKKISFHKHFKEWVTVRNVNKRFIVFYFIVPGSKEPIRYEYF